MAGTEAGGVGKGTADRETLVPRREGSTQVDRSGVGRSIEIALVARAHFPDHHFVHEDHAGQLGFGPCELRGGATSPVMKWQEK